jgi:hypothetical protein
MAWLSPEHPLQVPLLALALLFLAGLIGPLVIHLWMSVWRWFADFWHAVLLWFYLGRPWRCAWYSARRRQV